MSTITYRRNGATRTIPTGFSVTTLFFGSIPSFYRGHWLVAIPALLLIDLLAINLSLSLLHFEDFGLSLLAVRAIVASFRNRWLAEHFEADGWTCRADGIFEVHHKQNPIQGA